MCVCGADEIGGAAVLQRGGFPACSLVDDGEVCGGDGRLAHAEEGLVVGVVLEVLKDRVRADGLALDLDAIEQLSPGTMLHAHGVARDDVQFLRLAVLAYALRAVGPCVAVQEAVGRQAVEEFAAGEAVVGAVEQLRDEVILQHLSALVGHFDVSGAGGDGGCDDVDDPVERAVGEVQFLEFRTIQLADRLDFDHPARLLGEDGKVAVEVLHLLGVVALRLGAPLLRAASISAAWALLDCIFMTFVQFLQI